MLVFVDKMEGPTALPRRALHVDYVEWPQRVSRFRVVPKVASRASIQTALTRPGNEEGIDS